MIIKQDINGLQEITMEELEEALKKFYGDGYACYANIELAIGNMKRGDYYSLHDGKYHWCKTLDKPMDELTKASIELAWSLQYVIRTLPKECKEAYEKYKEAYMAEIGKKIPAVAVNVEMPILDGLNEDLQGFREELEKIAGELRELLDGFNGKREMFPNLQAEITFSIKEV